MKPLSRLLIVDDHVAFREYLKKIITGKFPHMTVEEAGDGDEVLAKISESKPQLIFMDIRLPGKNGLELTREIKANHPDIRIAILTSFGREYRKAANDSGADGFFEKGRSSLKGLFALTVPALPPEE